MGELIERLKEIGDLFKNAIEMLHGVGSPIKICLLAAVLAFAVVWMLVAALLEFIKKVKDKHEGLVNMETKHPKFFAFLYSGKVRFFLLVVVILFFAIDWRDATTIGPPSGVVKPPPVPNVTFVQQGSESPDNKPLRMFISAQMLEKVGDPAFPSRKMFVLLAVTNKKVSPVDVVIECNSDFLITEQPLVASQEEAAIYLMTKADQLSGNKIRYKMQSPAWGPESPMEIPIMVNDWNQAKPMKCTVSPPK